MHYSGQVGDTFTMEDNPPFKSLFIILTEPNDNGKIVLVSMAKAQYGVQTYVVFTPKDHKLFRGRVTARYQDANFYDHHKIVKYQNKHIDRCKHHCPSDIIKRIVAGAFDAKQSPIKVLNELQVQYPDIASS
jgi:hypothetical protein